ncbi:MAG: hypothetical protein ACF8XB_12090 [Planctomycetota bacterium JB042]
MKRVVLRPRGGRARPLRSDTLFGLLAWGVREVVGGGALDRLLEPPSDAGDEPALVVTSAFPCEAERSWFPRPVDEGPGLQDDATLLARIGGGAPAAAPSPPPPAPHDLFFLAYGRAEPWLEGALRYLERAGFGGGAARGDSGYDVTLEETTFVRPARPGELGLLLSLCFPTPTERAALVAAARERSDVRYEVERRRGVVGGRRLSVARPFKKAVTMLREGSVLPVAGVGAAPVVGRVEAEGEAFDVRQPGYGFFVPWTGGAA